MSQENTNKPKKPAPGLGKGLGALIPSIQFSKEKGFKIAPTEEAKPDVHNFAMIEIEKIKQNPYQPRHEFDRNALDDLKNSIREHGVIQPITVRPSINGYELISGERRLRATTELGLKTIPAYILEVKSDREMLEIALIENVQRENLNPIEIAHGYNRLIEECNYTQEQVAERVGKDRSTVTNFLRLLRLPESTQELLRSKRISMGHARALLGLGDHAKMLSAQREIIDSELSVRATEALVRDIETGKVKVSPDGGKVNKKKDKADVVGIESALTLDETETRLRQKFGTNVKIYPKTASSGTIEFEFYSIDDFERLVDLFEKNL